MGYEIKIFQNHIPRSKGRLDLGWFSFHYSEYRSSQMKSDIWFHPEYTCLSVDWMWTRDRFTLSEAVKVPLIKFCFAA